MKDKLLLVSLVNGHVIFTSSRAKDYQTLVRGKQTELVQVYDTFESATSGHAYWVKRWQGKGAIDTGSQVGEWISNMMESNSEAVVDLMFSNQRAES